MRSRWNLPVYIVYVVFCCLVAGLVIQGIGVSAPWSKPYEVAATFQSGDGILANNEVYMNGLKVGKVESVDAVRGKALVTMRIDNAKALPLYGDAGAMVRKKNLLGETYVEVSRGTQGSGDLNVVNGMPSIPVDRTFSPVEIDQVLAILDPQTRDRVKLLINGAGDALTNNGVNMNAQAQSLRTLSEQLLGPANELTVRKQQTEDIVLELQKLYDVLAKQRDQVRDEFATWSMVMGQLAGQESAIGGTLQQADTLLQNTDTLLTGEVPQLQAILNQLPSTVSSLQAFLTQSNDIFTAIAPYRRGIHNVFSDLQTTFADQDPTSALDPTGLTKDHQHFWSVFNVSCHGDCTGTGASTAGYQAPQAPNATWAAVMGTG